MFNTPVQRDNQEHTNYNNNNHNRIHSNQFHSLSVSFNQNYHFEKKNF